MKLSANISEVGFTEHYKSDGVYCRVLHIKAGDIAIGALHLTTHLNVLLKGKVSIGIGNEVRTVEAPYIFEALEGSRKVAYAHSNVQIMNIIPTDLEDLDDIENAVVDKTIPDNIESLLQPLRLLQGE
jgi:hypothetical protein